MSIAVMSDVWELDLESHLLLTLLAFADHADDSGRCFPSKRRISEKTGASPRTVQRHIRELRDRGRLAIDEESTPNSPPVYIVLPDRGDDLSPREGSGESRASPRGETRASPGGDTGVSQTVKEPSGEPSEERTNGGSADGSAPELELELEDPESNGAGSRDGFPAASELPRVANGNRIEYPDEFEIAWDAYPDRRGSDPKKGAYGAWRARTEDGASPRALAAKAEEYAEFVRSEGDEGTRYVMQAKTFFGPEEPWSQEWLDQQEARSEADRRAARKFADVLEATREQDRRATSGNS